MGTISLRVPDNELKAIKSYAYINNISVSDAIRRVMLEKIEDEYDLKVFEEYEEEKASGKLKTRPIEELWDELNL